MTRRGTRARIERRKRAMARLSIIPERDWKIAVQPNTNIRRFKDEDEFATYFARKNQERSALQVKLLNIV